MLVNAHIPKWSFSFTHIKRFNNCNLLSSNITERVQYNLVINRHVNISKHRVWIGVYNNPWFKPTGVHKNAWAKLRNQAQCYSSKYQTQQHCTTTILVHKTYLSQKHWLTFSETPPPREKLEFVRMIQVEKGLSMFFWHPIDRRILKMFVSLIPTIMQKKISTRLSPLISHPLFPPPSIR